LNILLLSEGLYNENMNLLNLKDTVSAYLRNSNSPFDLIDSSKAVIDTLNFTENFVFQNAASGTYYAQVKHRNSLETWSKTGGEVFTSGDTLNYDFTTSQSQAFGNNLTLKGIQVLHLQW
jgi:hypothetical protein